MHFNFVSTMGIILVDTRSGAVIDFWFLQCFRS
jgi:hypothetical protein